MLAVHGVPWLRHDLAKQDTCSYSEEVRALLDLSLWVATAGTALPSG